MTEFNTNDIKEIHERFMKITKGNEYMDMQNFTDFMGLFDSSSSKMILDRIYLTIRDNKNGISFRNLILYLNTLIYGNEEKKLRLCFDLIDLNKNGYFQKEDLVTMIFSVLKSNAPNDGENDLYYRAHNISTYLIKKFDANNEGTVDFKSFIVAVEKDPNIIEMFTKINKGISEAIIVKTIEEDRMKDLIGKMKYLRHGLKEIAWNLGVKKQSVLSDCDFNCINLNVDQMPCINNESEYYQNNFGNMGNSGINAPPKDFLQFSQYNSQNVSERSFKCSLNHIPSPEEIGKKHINFGNHDIVTGVANNNQLLANGNLEFFETFDVKKYNNTSEGKISDKFIMAENINLIQNFNQNESSKNISPMKGKSHFSNTNLFDVNSPNDNNENSQIAYSYRKIGGISPGSKVMIKTVINDEEIFKRIETLAENEKEYQPSETKKSNLKNNSIPVHTSCFVRFNGKNNSLVEKRIEIEENFLRKTSNESTNNKNHNRKETENIRLSNNNSIYSSEILKNKRKHGSAVNFNIENESMSKIDFNVYNSEKGKLKKSLSPNLRIQTDPHNNMDENTLGGVNKSPSVDCLEIQRKLFPGLPKIFAKFEKIVKKNLEDTVVDSDP